MRRWRKVAAAAASAIALATLIGARPALANAGANCGTGSANHCYSIIYATTSSAYSDLRATIPSENLAFNASPSTGEFLDGEMWALGVSGNWIETGFIKQYNHSYEVFWADNKPNCTSNCFFFHSYLFFGSDPVPANHTFEIIRTSTAGHWNVWYDSTLEGLSTVSGMNSSTQGEWGSELFTHDSDKFYSCFQRCFNNGLGSGVWNMYALPYSSGTAYNWGYYLPVVTPSSDYHGGQTTIYPWIWTWYKQLN